MDTRGSHSAPCSRTSSVRPSARRIARVRRESAEGGREEEIDKGSDILDLSAPVYRIRLEGGEPWGIRLQGGFEFAQHIRIAQVNSSSEAYNQGVRIGDIVTEINGTNTEALEQTDALYLLRSNKQLCMELKREYRPPRALPVIGRVTSPTCVDLKTENEESHTSHGMTSRGSVANDWQPSNIGNGYYDNRSRSSSVQSAERRRERPSAGTGGGSDGWSAGESVGVKGVPLPSNQQGGLPRAYRPIKFDALCPRPIPSSSNVQVQDWDRRGSSNSAEPSHVPRGAWSGYPSTETPSVSNSFPGRYDPLQRKASDPGIMTRSPRATMTQNQTSSDKYPPHYPQQRPQSGHTRPVLTAVASAPDSETTVSPSNTAGCRSPPPTFRKISDFEKHYGTLLPDSVPTSPSRQRLIRQSTDPLSTCYDSTAPRPAVRSASPRPTVRSSIRPNRSSTLGPQRKEDESTKSKGMQMFYNQRNKNSAEGEPQEDRHEGGQSNGYTKIDYSTAEKYAFPSDHKKVHFSDVTSTKRPEPEPEKIPEVQKSSARIRLLDSEESDVESAHGSQRPSRSIAVKSLRRGVEPPSTIQSTSSPRTRIDSTTNQTRPAPVSTSQDFLKSLDSSKKKGKEKVSSPGNVTGSNLKEIKVCSRRSDTKPNCVSDDNSSVSRSLDITNQSSPSTSTVGKSVHDSNHVSNHEQNENEVSQSDWYKHVFKALHKVEPDEDPYYQSFDESEKMIPPRPLKSKDAVTSDADIDEKLKKKNSVSKIENVQTPIRSTNGCKTAPNQKTTRRITEADACFSDSALSPNSTLSNSSHRTQQTYQSSRASSLSGRSSRHSGRLPVQPSRSVEDKQICDDSYWLKLGGLENKEPKTNTMLIHPEGYKSDSEAVSEAFGSWRDNDPPPRREPAYKRRGAQTKPLGKAKALYDFEAAHENELSFRENEILTLVSKIDRNWFQAELRGSRGIVPTNYLQMISDNDVKPAMKVKFDSPARPSTQRNSLLTVDPLRGVTQPKGDSSDSNWYEGNLGSCTQIYPAQSSSAQRSSGQGYPAQPPSVQPRSDSKRDLSGLQESSVNVYSPGVESSRSTSPLSSILSSNAPLSPNYDTDADLDKLIYDALLAIEDASQTSGQQRNRFDHLPTNPAQPYSHSKGSPSTRTSVQPVRNSPGSPQRQRNIIKSNPQQVSKVPKPGVHEDIVRAKPPSLKSTRSPTLPRHDSYPQTHNEQDLDDILMGDCFNLPNDPWLLSPKKNSSGNYSGGENMSSPNKPPVRKDLKSGLHNNGRGFGGAKRLDDSWHKVLYNYSPQHEDELELRQGDLVYLLERCDDGWCVGHADRTKKLGTFPGNYVVPLR